VALSPHIAAAGNVMRYISTATLHSCFAPSLNAFFLPLYSLAVSSSSFSLTHTLIFYSLSFSCPMDYTSLLPSFSHSLFRAVLLSLRHNSLSLFPTSSRLTLALSIILPYLSFPPLHSLSPSLSLSLFRLFRSNQKALNVAKETYMRINEEGIMCIQHQVESENGHETYIGNERTLYHVRTVENTYEQIMSCIC
jgi:hypothetical protein